MCRHYNANYSCVQCLKEVFITGQQLKNHLKICMGFPKAGTHPHLRRNLCPRVPRRAPKQACVIASVQRRSQTLPRSPVGKVPTPRCTRSLNATKRRPVVGQSRQKQVQQVPQEVNCVDGALLMSILLQLCMPKAVCLSFQKCCSSCSFNHHFTYVLHNPLCVKFFSHS